LLQSTEAEGARSPYKGLQDLGIAQKHSETWVQGTLLLLLQHFEANVIFTDDTSLPIFDVMSSYAMAYIFYIF
jgi:hypothetical protein